MPREVSPGVQNTSKLPQMRGQEDGYQQEQTPAFPGIICIVLSISPRKE